MELLNPGKQFYMLFANESLAFIDSMVENNVMPLVRKAMIRYCLFLNLTGRWEKAQLFQHLQDIIDNHPLEFEVQNPIY